MNIELDKMHIDHLRDRLRDLEYERDDLEYELSFIYNEMTSIEKEIERRETLDD